MTPYTWRSGMTVADCGDVEGGQRHAHDRAIDCFNVVRGALGACSSLPSHSDRVDAVDGLGQQVDRLVGAENSVTSCDLQVLVDETAEAVSSEWSDGRAGGRGSAACGRVLIE